MWWERAAATPAFCDAYARLPAGLRAELPRVTAASEFVAAALLRDPALLDSLEQAGSSFSSSSGTASHYAALVAGAATPEEASRVLREWRRRTMVRIAWADLSGRAPVTQSLRQLSDLADACIQAAAAAAQRHLEAPFGRPRSAAGAEVAFIVVGMGKLGGRELNFSSDVDLVFLYGEGGETDGARPIDHAEYFERVGRELIRLLDARTEGGFVFRVDMRLRPFGDSGALVASLASLESYLQEHGRDWERYAWIKARAITGAADYAAAHREFIRPFVYRRYLDFGVFDSLRDMKALIAREVARHELDGHLKLGTGGIRELEFIVQSLQLVRGGSDLRLQNSALLEVLPLLAGSKLLTRGAVEELRDAYLVLRKAENAVQMIRDAQTHVLPGDSVDRARLALAMGLPDWPSVLASIDAARVCVARRFGALMFGAPGVPGESSVGEAEWPESALIQAYRTSPAYRRLDEAARRRLHVILRRLEVSAARRAEPATVVGRVLRVLEAIGARSSYLALLKEQAPALERLIDVCAVSGFLARQIADFPLLLDELIDPAVFDEPPSRDSLRRELDARTDRVPADDPERGVEALRQFQKAAVFAVAFADLTARLPLMKVSDCLTEVAELIVERCVNLGWDQMTRAHGIPFCLDGPEPRPVRVAVAGYGKLGGLELGYGSDLDLVFLHDSSGEHQQTDGERPLDNSVFLMRLGQRIVHLLTMHSSAGRLYDVDMRLRPNGRSGFLMTGIDAFERYQREEAWTWEHQALLRARAIAGAPDLRSRFEAVRRRVLSTAVRRATLRTDVAEMRLRMRRELSKSGASLGGAEPGSPDLGGAGLGGAGLGGPPRFDIKQDAGGIADIEFLVQYWVLEHAASNPALLTYTDNIRQLEGLAAAGVLDAATAQWLTDAYIAYRTELHHLSLEGDDRVVDAAPHAARRQRVGQIWAAAFETNPLLAAWTLEPGGLPPLGNVHIADFKPAFATAIAEKLREVAAIAADPAPPTFDNTVVALERAGAAFDRVNAIYEIWSASMNTGEFQAVELEMGPRIAALQDTITQNAAVFARIEAVYAQSLDTAGDAGDSGPRFSAEQRRLCWLHHINFVRAGARLDAAGKRRVAAINERLAALYAGFSQNLLADESERTLFFEDPEALDGLPAGEIAAAAAAATGLGRPGEWAILNTRSAMEPFLTFAHRRDLREQVFRNFTARGSHDGPHDNRKIITDILGLRRERALLLGWPTHAHWRLDDSMAGSPQAAIDLLLGLWPAAVARVRDEVAEMQALADHPIEPWDYRYYADQIRRAKFDLDVSEVKPYLQLEKLREALFWAAQRLYGFGFRELERIPLAHPDVRVWQVTTADGRHAGLWYFDPFARAGKNSGAWMSEYRAQSGLDGGQAPIVSNNTNFLKGEAGASVLIGWDDAVTLFHEFGHALHGLCSAVTYPSLSGTRVVRDFVEFPSQLNENWLATPELLSRFALHHRTGEPMPAALAAKLRAARTGAQGFATVEYLAAALVDLRLHLETGVIDDPLAYEQRVLDEIGMPAQVVMRHRTPQFAHIFAGDGYSAGYYSYLWAEVLDHDAFEAFLDAGDPFDKSVAKRLHDAIMCAGNSRDPAAAYRDFRGRDPAIGALLRARGFAVPAVT
jgi:glutamine synthetase adenylyltransferase/Zn-dependent oligopeptidase